MSWITVEDEELSDKIRKFLELRIVKCENNFSLHCWDEVYNLPGVKYRLSGTFNNEDCFTLEYWRD